MYKVSLLDEDSILLARISDFLMEKEKYIVISKNSDVASFFKRPPIFVNIIITNLLPNYLEKIDPYKSLKKEFPLAKILVLTHQEFASKAYEAMKMGADGFCLKSDSLEDLEKGLDNIMEFGNYVSNSVLPFMVKSFRAKSNFEGEDILTAKEKLIVKLVCQGQSYKMIAGDTDLSIDGVRYHLQRIYRKLEINSKAELIAIAMF
jgi:DNA-binding NarL/FixJ family response regulator